MSEKTEEIGRELIKFTEELEEVNAQIKILEEQKKALEEKKKNFTEFLNKEKIRRCEEKGGHEFYYANAKWQSVNLQYCYHCPKEIGR